MRAGCRQPSHSRMRRARTRARLRAPRRPVHRPAGHSHGIRSGAVPGRDLADAASIDRLIARESPLAAGAFDRVRTEAIRDSPGPNGRTGGLTISSTEAEKRECHADWDRGTHPQCASASCSHRGIAPARAMRVRNLRCTTDTTTTEPHRRRAMIRLISQTTTDGSATRRSRQMRKPEQAGAAAGSFTRCHLAKTVIASIRSTGRFTRSSACCGT